MAAVMQGLDATYSGVADQAFRDAQAKQAQSNPTERLKQLTQMRDAGLITDEEFAAKKAELLEAL